MGFRSGLLVGFGVGYVLGAKAGRERYEELRRAWNGLTGNPTVQRVVSTGKETVETGARKGLEVVQEQVDRAAGAVKRRVEGERLEDARPVGDTTRRGRGRE